MTFFLEQLQWTLFLIVIYLSALFIFEMIIFEILELENLGIKVKGQSGLKELRKSVLILNNCYLIYTIHT